MFTDIVGSTKLASSVGDRRWRELLGDHHELIRRELRRFGGREVDTSGDGFLARFDNPTQAILCALSAVGKVHDLDLRIRAAIHTGEVEMLGHKLAGIAVHIGARVLAEAGPDEVLVSSTTRDLVTGAGLLFRDRGAHRFKGVAGTWSLFAAMGSAEADAGEDRSSPGLAGDDERGSNPSNLAWVELAAAEAFVDRMQELRTLQDAWSQAVTGNRVLALLLGEPGIGKTTLAAKLARQVWEDDSLVLYGRWDEEALAPYQGFREALGEYARSAARSVLAAELQSDAGEISRLVPEIARRLGAAEVPYPVDAEAERFRLFEALDAWISEIASRRPVLMVLDDIHWADRPSLLLILHLLRSARPARLLLVAIYRDSDLDGSDLKGAMESLTRDTAHRRVALAGLSRGDVAEMVDRLTASELGGEDPSLAEELRQETAGNPFFVHEVVRHLLDVGALPKDGASVERPPGGFGIPESVRDVVRWRLARLPPECTDALTVGAVIGQRFGVDILAVAASVPEDRLLELLEEAARAGLVQEVPDEEGRFSFTHAVVRRALFDGPSQARRARMHRRIGEALEARGLAETSPAELAYHFAASASSGAADQAIRFARLAGDRALEEVAYEAAVRHQRQALELQEKYQPDDAALRCELLLELGRALDEAGDYAARDASFAKAADLARELDRTDLFTRAALAYAGVLPSQVWPDTKAVMLIEEALERSGDARTTTRAQLLGRLAHWLHYAQPYATRLELSDRSLDIARENGDARTLAAVLAYRSGALHGPGDVDDEVALGEEVIQLGRQLGDFQVVLQGMRIHLTALLALGDVEVAGTAARALIELATRVRHPEYLRLAAMWEVLESAIEGRLEDAERQADQLHRRLQQIGHQQAELIYYGELQPLRWLQGRTGEILPLFEMLWQGEPNSLTWAGAVAWFAGEMGMDERVRDIRRSATIERVAAATPNYLWWGTVVSFAQAAVLVPDAEWAETLYDMMLPYAGHNCTVGLVSFNGAVTYHLGALAGVLGRWDDAADHLEQALRRHEAMGARPFVALTQGAYARVLAARGGAGDAARAASMRDQALRTARELGLGVVEARIARA